MRIALQLAWDPAHIDSFLSTARAADEAGVHSLWVNEGFGHDAFSGLTILARETSRVLLGTSIVNVYSRTPGAIAQHLATIDELSGGRVLVGLGASGQAVVERFHGQPFAAPRDRLRETADLIRAHWKKQRFTYEGQVFRIDRALELGARPVQSAPPIFFATMAPASVRLTATVADGWLPAWIPLDRLGDEIQRLRAWVTEGGREASAVAVRSPATTVVIVDPSEEAPVRRGLRETLAFIIARNGDSYHRQFLREAWAAGGRDEALAAMPERLEERFGFVGRVDSCREQLLRQQRLGVDIHVVSLAPSARPQAVRLLGALVNG